MSVFSTEMLAELMKAKLPLVLGAPVIEAGVSGMQGALGIVVPSHSTPGQWSVLWTERDRCNPPGLLQTSITHGTVLDVSNRIGFLLALDESERRGVRVRYGRLSSGIGWPQALTTRYWDDLKLRAEMLCALVPKLVESAPQ